MYVYESILSNSTYDTTTETSSSDMDKEAFLTVFLAQLENQDPLNPVENTEMISQLAEFSNLEQLTNISEAMDGLSTSLASLNVTSAVSYLGKEVTAEGNSVAVSNGEVSEMTFELGEDAASVSVDVYNSDGDIVYSGDLGAVSEGEHTYQWDGTDEYGQTCDDGIYYVKFYALDEYEDTLDVSTKSQGVVTGLTSVNGTTVLELEDGRQVSLLNVTMVNEPTDSTSQ